MKCKTLTLVTLILFLTNCAQKEFLLTPSQKHIIQKTLPLSKKDLTNWLFKDIHTDTIPGISLDKTYNKLIKNRQGKEVLVAVIDMEIDINHKDLKDNIWTNPNEIPNNHIDDDGNGYIDDIHGWNFLGKDNVFVNYEYTRIVKKYAPLFKSKKLEEIQTKDTSLYKKYNRALTAYNIQMKYALAQKKEFDSIYNSYYRAKKYLKSYFTNENYKLPVLDSLKKTATNTILKADLDLIIELTEYKVTEEAVINLKLHKDERIHKLLGLDYNDRRLLHDNPDDLNDSIYGNNILDANLTFLKHGTKIAGIIGAKRKNGFGVDGIANNVKILPVAVAALGDEHDKDIALAIRYAVHKGAKIINMSFGKEFSLHPEWVYNAIKYAAKHNVLIVSSAGNGATNLNIENKYYPNDNIDNGKEIADNFILVGATSYKLDENFVRKSSNYGNIDVDIFAPGTKIYSLLPNNKYTKRANGTSAAAAVVSGIATLLLSYYPNLTAQEIKHIIMDSGVGYNLLIRRKVDNKEVFIPFKELSKSGKLVNAYNAFVLAEKYVKRKK